MLRLTFSEEDIYLRNWIPSAIIIGIHGSNAKWKPCCGSAKGLPHHQIACCVGGCENTVRSYFQQYQSGGIEAKKRLEFRRPTSDLEAYHDTIQAYFREHPATTIPSLRQGHRGIDGHQGQSHPGRHLAQKAGVQALEHVYHPSQV